MGGDRAAGAGLTTGTICWPNSLPSRSITMRKVTSTALPGAELEMIRIGLFG